MKSLVRRSAFFALVGLVLSPLAVAHASPSPADSVHFCLLPFDYQQGQRDHIHPAAKRLAETALPSEDEESTEDFLIREPSQAVQETFGLTSFYQQWIDVEGFPVVASEKVSPYAVKEAAWLIRHMTSHRPNVLQAMVQNKASFSVIAYNEMLTQIPEYSYLRPGFFWDLRARGLGGLESSCGEENLLNYPGDLYEGSNVLIHEFVHSMHRDGLNTVDPDFDNRLQGAFEAAIAKGLWKGTYSSTNEREYWAEGARAWFNAQYEFLDINTRTKLKDYDPELVKLLAEVFGDTDWRYTLPATRTHLPHLQGFNPQESPTFEWPPELIACRQQLFEPDGYGGDKWMNLEPYNPSQLSRLRSPSYETSDTEIILVNETGAEITYYWIDADGTERYHSRLAFGFHVIWTYVGQIWLIKDQHGNDLAVFRAEKKTGRAFIGPVQANTLTETSDEEGEAPPTLEKISGDEQQGLVGAALAEPFVVSVLDEDGAAIAGAIVTFSVPAGGGTLSATTATTDANGRARSTLTLGPDPGTNTVTATVEGLEPITFTATAGGPASDSQEDPEPDPQLESLSVTIDDVTSAAERGRMTFTVRLEPTPIAPTTVKYATASQTATAGQDYEAATGTLHFGANQNTATFTVRIRPDEQDEPNETFAVRITHPSTGARLAGATGTITDDDSATPPEGDSDGDELADSEEDDGGMAFGFSGAVEDQAYTAGAAISALVLPEATGGEGEVTYRVLGLPAGLSFDAATRTISGTPEAATDGAVEITYTAEDSAGEVATLTFSITVNPALSFGDLFDLFGAGGG